MRIWGRRIGKSPQLMQAEKHLHLELLKYKTKAPIKDYINCKLTFIFPHKVFYTQKGDVNKKLPDLSNLYQIVEDELQKVGIIENDHLIASHDGSRRLPGDSFKLIIELSRLEGVSHVPAVLKLD